MNMHELSTGVMERHSEWVNEQIINGKSAQLGYGQYAYVPMPAQQSSSVPDGPLHISIRRRLSSTATFCQQSWSLCSTAPAQYL